MIIVGIIICIVLIGVLIRFVKVCLALPTLLVILLSSVAVIVVSGIVFGIIMKSVKLTSAQLARLKNAREKDRGNQHRHKKDYEDNIFESTHELSTARSKLAAVERMISSTSILASKKDQRLEVVDFVIGQMESGRASTLQQALLQYDEWDRYKKKELEEYLRRLDEEWEREKRDREQKEHNDRMEELARKRAREAEKAREEAEKTRQIAEDMKRKYW